MGEVLKYLARTVLPDREAHNSRLFVDLCENIHIHHREFRVVFSLDEYFEYADVIAKSTSDVRNYLAQNPDYKEQLYGTTLMIAGGRVRQKKLLQNSPRPNSSQYFANDFAIELQAETVTDEIHVHWRDFRLALPREHFKIIAEQFSKAARELEEWETTNVYVRKPHRDRKIDDLEKERASLANEDTPLKGEVFLPLERIKTRFADIEREFKPDSTAIAALVREYRAGNKLFPILLSTESNGENHVIDGNHRFYAARKAGLKSINCVVAAMTFEDSRYFRKAEALLKEFDARTGRRFNVSSFNKEFIAYKSGRHYRDHFLKTLYPPGPLKTAPRPRYRKGLSRSLVEGRDVILVGSAPTFDGQLKRTGEELVVSVNGSALGLKSPIVPDITYINTSVSGTSGAGEETYRALSGQKSNHVVLLEGAQEYSEGWIGILGRMSHNSFDFVSLEARLAFLRKCLGPLTGARGNHLPSTGFYALLALLSHGARSVHLEGFSLVDGHSYLSSTHKRMHVGMDQKVIELINWNRLPVTGHISTSSGTISLGQAGNIPPVDAI